jgi:ribosomal protein S16
MASIRLTSYGGKAIPPRSIVKLLARWGKDHGRVFRIGYYNPQDGLNCVWLVNARGEYEQTADQRSIRRSFEVLELSDETDFFGVDRNQLGPLEPVA